MLLRPLLTKPMRLRLFLLLLSAPTARAADDLSAVPP